MIMEGNKFERSWLEGGGGFEATTRTQPCVSAWIPRSRSLLICQFERSAAAPIYIHIRAYSTAIPLRLESRH